MEESRRRPNVLAGTGEIGAGTQVADADLGSALAELFRLGGRGSDRRRRRRIRDRAAASLYRDVSALREWANGSRLRSEAP